MMEKRTELEKLQKERDELKRQNEELLEKYRRASGKEKDTLGTKLENQYGLGVIFDRCVAMIQRGEQHRAIETLGSVIHDTSVTDSPLAYAYYLRGRAYYELNYDSRALEDFGLAQDTPHDDSIYPVWRAHYYRGLIYYDRRQWKDAYAEIKTAWDASDKTDAEMEAALSKAKEKAYPSRRQGALEKILRDVLIGAIRGDYERP
jgi:tetratricopeptide (TPR) repeat protein